jgi:hypothetical protein
MHHDLLYNHGSCVCIFIPVMSGFSFFTSFSFVGVISQVRAKYRDALVRHCNGKPSMDLLNFKVGASTP